MKTLFLTCTLWSLSLIPAYAQTPPESLFDFWIGDWQLSWTKEDGTAGSGKNSIHRILGGKVIQENFEETGSGYQGMSLSVFSTPRNKWFQTWADSNGAYLLFTGREDNGKRIFETQLVERGERKLQQRMVFYNITTESFQWDWESTEDGGTTWKLDWRIDYKRIH